MYSLPHFLHAFRFLIVKKRAKNYVAILSQPIDLNGLFLFYDKVILNLIWYILSFVRRKIDIIFFICWMCFILYNVTNDKLQ